MFSSIWFRTYKKSKLQPISVPLITSEAQLDIPNVVSFYSLFSTCSGYSSWVARHGILWQYYCWTQKLVLISYICHYQVMIPSVDEIQLAINQLIDFVLEVSKGVTWQWEYTSDETKKTGNLPSLWKCMSQHTYIHRFARMTPPKLKGFVNVYANFKCELDLYTCKNIKLTVGNINHKKQR